MEARATFDDVNLILRLYELRREEKLRTARQWFFANFKADTLEELRALCPPGSDQDAYCRMVISYWDMAASFLTSGVLNKDLFFQGTTEMLMVWEKIRLLAPQMREAYHNPTMFANLETASGAFIQWMNKRAPEAYAALSARVR